jgi:hypothetical protein
MNAPSVGDWVRLTEFRGCTGVWWALVTGDDIVDVLYGTSLRVYGDTCPLPLKGWVLDGQPQADWDSVYEVFPPDNLPDEWYALIARRALLGAANPTD